MVLAVDIGNTTIAVGVLHDDALKISWRLLTNPRRLADEYGEQICGLLRVNDIPRTAFDAVIISSVVPSALREFVVMCERYFGLTPLIVSAKTNVGIELRCDYPEEVGADRITTSIGAHEKYGGPLIVVDFGTATTFDAVSEDGAYLGGVISPGVGISMDALFERTALLKRVDLSRPPSVIGKNTTTCIQSGFYYGYLGQMEGIIRRMKAELGQATRVVATGGFSSLIAKESELVDIIDPDLLLQGLRIIYHRLRKKAAVSHEPYGDSTVLLSEVKT